MLAGLSTLRRLRLCNAITLSHTTNRSVGGHTSAQRQQSTTLQPKLTPSTWGRTIRRIRRNSQDGQPISFCCGAENGSAQTHASLLSPGLYLVGTPIGNLEDLSVRALRVLQTATIILAEDTRHSRKLLNHYDIRAQMYSFHQHNEHSKQDKVRIECKSTHMLHYKMMHYHAGSMLPVT